MSGVDVSKEPKENRLHACESCMNTVIQSFSHFQEQIAQLQRERMKLQMELEKSREEQKEQKRVLFDEIMALEKKVAALKSES
jgi:uncharacterized protein YlxW (UPF0749 family)